jgi:hypothetical protein
MREQAYAAAYWVKNERLRPASRFAEEFRVARTLESFYDTGDDPAFFSAERLGGAVSWGVCRTDLRRKVNPGDVVVFFAVKKSSDGLDYFFKGYATVERKVSQVDVWTQDALRGYRRYLNLLIRPRSDTIGEFEWHEPVADHKDDWLWRIVDSNGRRKEEFGPLTDSKRFSVAQSRLPDGMPISVSPTYVIFAQDDHCTYWVPEPLHVASAPRLSLGKVEDWFPSHRIAHIRDLTVGRASTALGGSRGIKTRNGQRAHRHLVLDLVHDLDTWREELRDVVVV